MCEIEVVERHLHAQNIWDFEFLGALLSDQPVFELAGFWTFRGRKRVLQLAEWDAALDTHVEPSDLWEEGGCVFGILTWQKDWYRAAGIEEIRYQRFELHFVGRHIVTITAVMEPGCFAEPSPWKGNQPIEPRTPGRIERADAASQVRVQWGQRREIARAAVVLARGPRVGP